MATKINSYPKNSTVKVWGRFYDDAGDLSDPTAVVCQVITPNGTQVDYTYDAEPDEGVVRHGTGEYYKRIECTTAGTWRYRWYSTGDRSGDENEFTVAGSGFSDPS